MLLLLVSDDDGAQAEAWPPVQDFCGAEGAITRSGARAHTYTTRPHAERPTGVRRHLWHTHLGRGRGWQFSSSAQNHLRAPAQGFLCEAGMTAGPGERVGSLALVEFRLAPGWVGQHHPHVNLEPRDRRATARASNALYLPRVCAELGSDDKAAHKRTPHE